MGIVTHKYIRHSIIGCIVWPRHIVDRVWHEDMARLVDRECPGGKVISAGDVMFHEGRPHCYGSSLSLDLGSLPEDSGLLAQQLGLLEDAA